MLENNKFGKYLFYAIGETLLIIVGIMIALSFDGWNDEQIERQLEIKILKEIQDNLNYDIVELDDDLQLMVKVTKASRSILASIKSNESPSDNFAQNSTFTRVTPHFSPNDSGYQLLLSKGLELISDDNLRQKISRLYDSIYPYYERYENERIEYVLHHVQPFVMKYFEREFDTTTGSYLRYKTTQQDYENLRKDPEFRVAVNTALIENEAVYLRAKRVRNDITELQKVVTKVLENTITE